MVAAFNPNDPKLSPQLKALLGRLDSVTSRLEGAVLTLEEVLEDPEELPQEKT